MKHNTKFSNHYLFTSIATFTLIVFTAVLFAVPFKQIDMEHFNNINNTPNLAEVPTIITAKNNKNVVSKDCETSDERLLVKNSPVDGLNIHKNHKYNPEKNKNIVAKGNELILFVRYSDEASVQASLNRLGLKLERILQSDGTVIASNPDNLSPSDINELASEDKNILYIMDNCVRAKMATSENHDATKNTDSSYVPNDPFFKDMWHLSDENGISVSKAWETTKGSEDILVAVIDSGIVSKHVEFEGKIYKQYDIPDNDNNAEDTADFSHGSHVAGIIAANADNNIGICGIASGVKLLVIDVFYYDDFFDEEYAEDDDIFTAYDLCISEGANVANMSFGGFTDELNSSISRIYNNKLLNLKKNNIVSVAAAGNESTTEEVLPSDCDHVISVIATDRYDERCYFSNYGRDKDISAPGEDIISIENSTSYARADGTSMAAPIVSGVVALLLSYKKDLSPSQIENILYSTATRLGNATSSYKDPDYGYGKINAAAAMDKLISLFPSATPTVAPMPTSIPTIFTDSPNSLETPKIAENPTPLKTHIVSESPKVTATPERSATPTRSSTPDVKGSPTATPSATATQTIAPTENTAINSSPTVEPTAKNNVSIKFANKKIKLRVGRKKVLKVKLKGTKKVYFSIDKKSKKIIKLMKKRAKKVTVKARKKGKAIVWARSPGAKAKCIITVKR